MDGAPAIALDTTTSLTVGYENRTLAEFVALLQRNQVNRVLDVRELPLSRRKGFSKTPLRTALSEAGIEYVHLRAAGNPFRAEKGDIERCLTNYRKHLDASPEVFDLVAEQLIGRRTALLCVEALPQCCHRSVLVDGLRRRSSQWRVVHI